MKGTTDEVKIFIDRTSLCVTNFLCIMRSEPSLDKRFIALVIVFNTAIYALAEHFLWYIDMTEGQVFTLSSEAKAFLDDVEGRAFYGTQNPQPFGKAFRENGLADAEVAFQKKDVICFQLLREGFADGKSFLGRGCFIRFVQYKNFFLFI